MATDSKPNEAFFGYSTVAWRGFILDDRGNPTNIWPLDATPDDDGIDDVEFEQDDIDPVL